MRDYTRNPSVLECGKLRTAPRRVLKLDSTGMQRTVTGTLPTARYATALTFTAIRQRRKSRGSMAVQIFNLRNVPDDEAEDIRQLLTTHHIEHYETPAGRWGMSSPALWITYDDQREHVVTLIAQYQQQRALSARQLYDEQKAQGQHLTLWGLVKLHPLRYVAALLAIVFIMFVSVGPFLKWMGAIK